MKIDCRKPIVVLVLIVILSGQCSIKLLNISRFHRYCENLIELKLIIGHFEGRSKGTRGNFPRVSETALVFQVKFCNFIQNATLPAYRYRSSFYADRLRVPISR